jgi:cytidylate kinase
VGITIAVDGPASSGKGTVARAVARELGYAYVDTGAMYRAVALCAERRGVSWEDENALAALASGLRFRFSWRGELLRVEVDGEDVTSEIRLDQYGTGASRVSRQPAVRLALLGLQRALGAAGGVVMDGRDIGTVVLPDAELKIYLDADVHERARRRYEEILRRGEAVVLEQVLAAMVERDRLDMQRDVAPLRPADDAVVIDSTGRTPQAVTEQVLVLAKGLAPVAARH